MMKFLCLLLIIASSQGSVVKREVDIPRTSISKIVAIEPLGFVVGWNKIENPKIQGYKVRVWELQGDVVYHYETVDGKKKLVPTHLKPMIKPDVIPQETPKEIIVQGQDTLEAKFDNATEGVQYEIRVLGYTAEGDGPMSYPSGLKLGE